MHTDDVIEYDYSLIDTEPLDIYLDKSYSLKIYRIQYMV